MSQGASTSSSNSALIDIDDRRGDVSAHPLTSILQLVVRAHAGTNA